MESARDPERERDECVRGPLLMRSKLGLLLRVGVRVVQEKLCLDSHECSREWIAEARFESGCPARHAVVDVRQIRSARWGKR